MGKFPLDFFLSDTSLVLFLFAKWGEEESEVRSIRMIEFAQFDLFNFVAVI